MSAVGKTIGFEPFMIAQFIDADLLALIQMQLKLIKSDRGKFVKEEKVYFRKEIHNHPLMAAVHEIIHARVEAALKRPLKKTYCFIALYEPGEGRCPPHTDRPECQYSVDLCLQANKPWAFCAQSEDGLNEFRFEQKTGDAILLSGTHHRHWRPDVLPSDQYCDLVFFHFVDRE